MVVAAATDKQAIIDLLEQVPDPEIPVISIVELGLVKAVHFNAEGIGVDITPTWTGCPAMKEIEEDICRVLNEAGYPDVNVRTLMSPPWTTDDISEVAKQKLKAYGIAPPGPATCDDILQPLVWSVQCPRCDSMATEQIVSHGSTSCKALYRCTACDEPFEYFKPL